MLRRIFFLTLWASLLCEGGLFAFSALAAPPSLDQARTMKAAALEKDLPGLDHPNGYALRWWTARKHLEEKNWSRARMLLTDLSKADHPLRPLVLLDLGDLQRDGKIPPPAWVRLSAQADSGIWRERAMTELVKWYQQRKRFTEAWEHLLALEEIRPLSTREQWDVALWGAAYGDQSSQRLVLLLEEGPDPKDFVERDNFARNHLGHSLVEHLDDLAWLRRARRLGHERSFKSLLRDRHHRMGIQHAAPIEVLLWETYALLVQAEDPATAKKVLEYAGPRLQKSDSGPGRLVHLLSRWHLDQLSDSQLRDSFTSEGGQWGAWGMEEALRHKPSLARQWHQELADSACDREHVREALWNESLMALQNNDQTAAFDLLAAMDCPGARADSNDRLRSLFFRASLHLKNNNRAQAVPLLEEAERMDRYGYYGYKSRQLLGKTLPQGKVVPPYPENPLPKLPDQDLALRLDVFSRLQLYKEARLDWDYLHKSPRPPAQGKAMLLSEARYWYRLGETARAVVLTRRAYPKAYTSQGDHLSAEIWGLLYPLAYETHIVKNAREKNLDPILVASLIRQESLFQKDAISRSGARGLMQLMPSTGKWLAKKEGKRVRTSQLSGVDLNVHLGTTYLRSMLDRYSGNTAFALAAYNAGPGRVDGWQSQFSPDLDIWIESLPFSETRGYVRKILLNTWEYQRLRHSQLKVPESGATP